jgi:hypothetical protein
MRLYRDDFDDSIRGHMALTVRERIERGVMQARRSE